MTTKVVESFSQRLRKALSLKNMKQIDLVRATGISESAISQYLSGYARPKDDRVHALAVVLGVSEGWLLGFDATMERETSQNNRSIDKQLTQEESHLIDSFRRLDKDGQIDVIEYVEFKAHKSKSVLRDKPSTTIIDAPFQVRAAHAHDPNSDGSELKGDFDMLEEAVRNDQLRKNGKKD